MKKIFLLFILVLNITYGKDVLRRTTKLEYDRYNNLIRVQEFNKEKKKIHEIEYQYDEENRISRYIYNGKRAVSFDYNTEGRIESIENYYGLYEFNYHMGSIRSYDLRANRPEAGRYYIFSREPVFKMNQYGFLISSVTKRGEVVLFKATPETFTFSNQSTEVKRNKEGQIIEKSWGSKKDNEYHIKYFTYDSRGNLIEVRAVNRIKVLSSLFEGIGYLFSIMVGGYKN